MKISERRLRISDSLKISDFSNSLGVLQHPQAPPAIRLYCLVAIENDENRVIGAHPVGPARA